MVTNILCTRPFLLGATPISLHLPPPLGAVDPQVSTLHVGSRASYWVHKAASGLSDGCHPSTGNSSSKVFPDSFLHLASSPKPVMPAIHTLMVGPCLFCSFANNFFKGPVWTGSHLELRASQQMVTATLCPHPPVIFPSPSDPSACTRQCAPALCSLLLAVRASPCSFCSQKDLFVSS